MESLKSAESWSTWDMVGGGLISDMAKYGKLDEAQGKVEQLQEYLRCFKTELADVKVDASISIHIDSFMQFADYFFDGLFVDWAVRDKILKSEEQVNETIKRIEKVISHLDSMLKEEDRKMRVAKQEIEDMLAF